MKDRREGFVYVVMDCLPGPLSQFVELEDAQWRGVKGHRWIQEGDKWLLELPAVETDLTDDVIVKDAERRYAGLMKNYPGRSQTKFMIYRRLTPLAYMSFRLPGGIGYTGLIRDGGSWTTNELPELVSGEAAIAIKKALGKAVSVVFDLPDPGVSTT